MSNNSPDFFKFLLVLSLLSAFVYCSNAQSFLNQKIKIDKADVRVFHVLEDIFPTQKIKISYLDNIIPKKKKLDLTLGKEYTVLELLIKICHNEKLTYEIVDDHIYLKAYDRPDKEYKFSISGRVKDKDSNEPLIGATVYVTNLSTGLATNGYGFYSLSLPKGKYKIVVSYIGYTPLEYDFDLDKNIQSDIYLNTASIEMDDIVIGDKEYLDLSFKNILSSTHRLDMELVESIPYLGEVDVFQGSLLLPGISNVGEGISGINVRGGTADQNLIMLDEAVVYNSNHFFGLVSVFNPDAVNDVEILKGDLPARYGGRVSSVMHIRQKEGNSNDFHISGGLGLLTSRLMAEGPMLDKKGSFLVSGRSTFWDLLLKNSSNPVLNNLRANFQDLNIKLKYNVNDRNKIYFSTYLGNDVNRFGDNATRRWGNRVYSFRWNKIIHNTHFFNFTAYFSQYVYRVTDESQLTGFVGLSRISDAAIKADFTTYLDNRNILEYGGSLIVHAMSPGKRAPGPGSAENEVNLPIEVGLEPSLYISSENSLTSILTTSIGLRLSAFHNTGRADLFEYKSDVPKTIETIIDTLQSGAKEAKKTYFNLMPRISAKLQINETMSAKCGFFQTIQYMHLLSNTISPSSSDTWKISGRYVTPTTMNQTTVGLYKYFRRLDFNASIEVFYRKLNNTINFKNGADLLYNNLIETELLNSEEHVYGLELYVKKSFGKLTGWVSYTLSKSEKRTTSIYAEEQINHGKFFPTDYDRRHDIAITGIYNFSNRFSLSTNFVYYTGRPFSFPDSKYEVDGILVPHYSERNMQRLPAYHRLDLSATLKSREIKRNGQIRKFEGDWVFTLYNFYNRRNTQAYYFTHNVDDPTKPLVQRLSVLGSILPSITYNFRF